MIERLIERPMPMPCAFSGEKGVKELGEFFGIYPHARVTHRQSYPVRVVVSGGDVKLPRAIVDAFIALMALTTRFITTC